MLFFVTETCCLSGGIAPRRKGDALEISFDKYLLKLN